MKKNVIALECSTSSVKIAVGYELDGEVIVNYAAKKNLPSGVIFGNQIGDEEYLSKQIVELVQDAKKTLKMDAYEVNLLLPPMGFEIYVNQQSTNVVSENGIVADTDIRNVEMLLIRSEYGNADNVVVDIIPQYYVLDDNRAVMTPPKGEISFYLGMRAYVHVLPNEIRNRFHEVVRHAGLKVSHSSVTPYAIAQLLESPAYKEGQETPNFYCLVDYGAKYTIVTIISKGLPIRSTYFELGSQDLTERISSKFHVTQQEAEELKELYGLDQSEHTYRPTISKMKDEEGKTIRFTVSDINELVIEHLNTLMDDLVRAIRSMFKEEEGSQPLTLVFVGGGSSLNGFLPYMQTRTQHHIQSVYLRNIGARDLSYAAVLGMLKIASLKQVVDQNEDRRVLNLSRKNETNKESKKENKRRYSDTDDRL